MHSDYTAAKIIRAVITERNIIIQIHIKQMMTFPMLRK